MTGTKGRTESRLASRRVGRRGTMLLGGGVALLLALSPGIVHAGYEGPSNTAYGYGALSNATGIDNSAFGAYALFADTTGSDNTATGVETLKSNTIGSDNTATGGSALHSNTSGKMNTATGSGALDANTTGSANTAIGHLSLDNSITGNENTAVGAQSLNADTLGVTNTAVGAFALQNNMTGSSNTALGIAAGAGYWVNRTGSSNTFLGSYTGPGSSTQLNRATAIGANALVNENDALVLGVTDANGTATRVGINTTTPQSNLQVGDTTTGAKTSYGTYIQIPTVKTSTAPPASDCNGSTYIGRMVLQYVPGPVQGGPPGPPAHTSLWICSAAGVWTAK